MTATADVDVVVVGGGQAGLAVGHELRRRARSFVVLDRETEVGAVWRRRWDSLRLFTPAGFTHLPGLALDGPPDASPTKDDLADHLVSYARRFALPIELDTTVASVDRDGDRLRVTAVDGRGWRARDVVLATGAHGEPDVPGFAADLDPGITRLHSGDYRRPAQLPDGAVLVVGAGNSGAEIAVDLAVAGREVQLSGRDVGHMPRLGSRTYPILRALGRPGAVPARRRLRGGDPLGRIRPGDLESAGVRRAPRTVGVRDGLPVLDDGSTARVAAVVWCTGLRPDDGLVGLPVRDGDGRLRHRRGITGEPGLYVVGRPYQSSITSHLVGGVGTDARYVVDHLMRRHGGRGLP